MSEKKKFIKRTCILCDEKYKKKQAGKIFEIVASENKRENGYKAKAHLENVNRFVSCHYSWKSLDEHVNYILESNELSEQKGFEFTLFGRKNKKKERRKKTENWNSKSGLYILSPSYYLNIKNLDKIARNGIEKFE